MKCTVDGCDREPRYKSGAGMCAMHYVRLQRLGSTDDPNRPRNIPDEAVRQIRAHHYKVGDVTRFAAMYRTSTQMISRIRAGISYKDVK